MAAAKPYTPERVRGEECEDCGGSIEAHRDEGRPREFCAGCSVAQQEIVQRGSAEARAAWGNLNATMPSASRVWLSQAAPVAVKPEGELVLAARRDVRRFLRRRWGDELEGVELMSSQQAASWLPATDEGNA